MGIIPKIERVISMQLQAYKGYFEQGNFYVAGKALHIPERQQITVIFEEQAIDDTLHEDLLAMKKFINSMEEIDDEEIPLSFERVKLREVKI